MNGLHASDANRSLPPARDRPDHRAMPLPVRTHDFAVQVHGRLECALPAGCAVQLQPIAATTVSCVEGRARLCLDDQGDDHLLEGGAALRIVAGRSLIIPTLPSVLRFVSEPPGVRWKVPE
jgi:hypothetical protein